MPNDDQTQNHTQVATAIAYLEQLADQRGGIDLLAEADKHRLFRAVNRLAHPDRVARKQMIRSRKVRERDELAQRKANDERLLAETGIRAQFSVRQLKKSCAPAPFDVTLPPATGDSVATGNACVADEAPRLQVARSCYTCKRDYERLHPFYDSLCPDCADLNWRKRHQSYDLTGRYALLTGGRVKIGYQAALKLLRAGAHVVVTTRFPHDATKRFLKEDDCDDWIDRLQLHGLDLRHTPSVEAFAAHLHETLPRLDFILNNACQTVRRPPGFYTHLMEGERTPAAGLPPAARLLLQSHDDLSRHGSAAPGRATNLPAPVDGSLAGIRRAAELSQIAVAPGDELRDPELFPEGQLDHDLQQVDLRNVNSWRLKLGDTPTVELLEVHLVNAVAPFILNSRMKPLMLRQPTRDKHIVNVSAMEGVFYRAYKTDRHPHTNMAKAALNMLTRTSAQDYVRDGIHMNSVDTGWITDEDPAEIARRKADEGFHPPLDIVDAAARICDPVFHGFLTGEHLWGNFLKDYQIANW